MSVALQPGGDRAGAAGPHRGHPDAAVPEARPLDVGAGPADRHRRDAVEVHVGGVAGDHARPGPDGGVGPDAVRGQLGEEQPRAVVGVRGDQGVRERARPRAPGLAAVQPPAAVHPPRSEPGGRWLGRPHAEPVAGLGRGSAELGEDGDGVGVPLGEAGQRKVGRTQRGQSLPPLRRRPVAGQGQRPAPLDQGSEGRDRPGRPRRRRPEGGRSAPGPTTRRPAGHTPAQRSGVLAGSGW